jgi:DNA mismatch repair protein MutS2
MASRFAAGDAVQTPHGKGVVLQVRNNGRLLVQVQQRAVVVAERTVTLVAGPRRPAPPPDRPDVVLSPRPARRDVDLHGLTVEEASTRIDEALDAALRAGHADVRFIHGRSGGRLRAALHARLRAIPTVRGFALDPRNPGVTIASL